MSEIDPSHAAFLGANHRAVLATIRRDGRPQLSTIDFTYDPGSRLLRMSSTDGRAKVANLRRDGRASMHVATVDGGAYVVADGVAEVTAPAEDAFDETTVELVDVYRAIQGEHPDWAEYRDVMASDRRVVIRLTVETTYGWIPEH